MWHQVFNSVLSHVSLPTTADSLHFFTENDWSFINLVIIYNFFFISRETWWVPWQTTHDSEVLVCCGVQVSLTNDGEARNWKVCVLSSCRRQSMEEWFMSLFGEVLAATVKSPSPPTHPPSLLPAIPTHSPWTPSSVSATFLCSDRPTTEQLHRSDLSV